MVRQKSRKTVEELYAAGPPAPPFTTTRFDESFFQNSKPSKCNKAADKSETCNNAPNCRRKSKGGAEKKDEKTFLNEGRTTKSKKSPSLDNKNFVSYLEETEKDEDTEEFFELIRETVENAVAKTLSDALNRHYKELNSKIDGLREQLAANETKIEKVQSDMNNKISHYGEENSRHFRYLCMKSEYDKMFYQHQNIVTSAPADVRPNLMNPNFTNHPQATHQTKGQQKNRPVETGCNCQVHGYEDFGNVDRSKSSVSTKSSEMGIKEVKELLEQLQKFYEQQQSQKNHSGKDDGGDVSLGIQDDSGDGDEDDSSDDLSSASIEEKLGAGGDT